MLIGCKYDIAPNGDGTTGNRKKVQEILQQEEWKKFQPISVECSAKTNHNVNGVFLACAELVLKDRKSPKIGNHQRVRPKPITLAPASQPAKSGGCCG